MLNLVQEFLHKSIKFLQAFILRTKIPRIKFLSPFLGIVFRAYSVT